MKLINVYPTLLELPFTYDFTCSSQEEFEMIMTNYYKSHNPKMKKLTKLEWNLDTKSSKFDLLQRFSCRYKTCRHTLVFTAKFGKDLSLINCNLLVERGSVSEDTQTCPWFTDPYSLNLLNEYLPYECEVISPENSEFSIRRYKVPSWLSPGVYGANIPTDLPIKYRVNILLRLLPESLKAVYSMKRSSYNVKDNSVNALLKCKKCEANLDLRQLKHELRFFQIGEHDHELDADKDPNKIARAYVNLYGDARTSFMKMIKDYRHTISDLKSLDKIPDLCEFYFLEKGRKKIIKENEDENDEKAKLIISKLENSLLPFNCSDFSAYQWDYIKEIMKGMTFQEVCQRLKNPKSLKRITSTTHKSISLS